MMGQPASQGAMGVHYFRPDLLGVTEPPSPRVDGVGTHTDFRTPSILIYEPQADGSMALVAVENLVFAKSWKATGKSAPPTFHGVPYDTMIDDPATRTDEAHMFAPHFDRHVWIYRDNPNGVFTPFNPTVTCKHHKGGAHPTGHSGTSTCTHRAELDRMHTASVFRALAEEHRWPSPRNLPIQRTRRWRAWSPATSDFCAARRAFQLSRKRSSPSSRPVRVRMRDDPWLQRFTRPA